MEDITTPDTVFAADNLFEIPVLQLEKQAAFADLPCHAWRSPGSAQMKKAGTIHFYTHDRHFSGLDKDPGKALQTPALSFVELNFSLQETDPLAVGMERIYRKRFAARLWQQHGRYIFVDLHVPDKYTEYNLLGVPRGWRAWATRGGAWGGYTAIERLDIEIATARSHADSEDIYFVVLGCNIPKVREWCLKNRAVYIPNYRGREGE